MSVSEMFKMELKNSKNNDYNLLILLKIYEQWRIIFI